MSKDKPSLFDRMIGVNNLEAAQTELNKPVPDNMEVLDQADKAAVKAMIFGWVLGALTGAGFTVLIVMNVVSKRKTD